MQTVQRFAIRVNGRAVDVQVDDRTPLLYVLRNDIGLNGPKLGCDGGECGACAVLCNGIEIASCQTLISAVDGYDIVTSEGLGAMDRGAALRRAFFEEQASQCGYCIPGMMVAAAALLGSDPAPSEDRIKAALERHICRCGTHVRILAAVRRAAAEPATASSEDRHSPERRLRGDRLAAGAVVNVEVTRSTDPRAAASWVEVDRDGTVTAYSGKIDMGTGVRTAYAQIVAEELDVPIDAVRVILGDTGATPDQGKSTASAGVMLGGQPLKVAASETRAALLDRAADRLQTRTANLDVNEGVVFDRMRPDRRVGYGELIGNVPLVIEVGIAGESVWGPQLGGRSIPKTPSEYRYVGTSVFRAVVADHVAGTFEYVHDVRVPGMLHGRVVRPPCYVARLLSVDEASIAHLPGVQVVRRVDFLGVVAEREEVAVEAALRLTAEWAVEQPLYEERRQFEALRIEEQIDEQVNFATGDVETALANSARRTGADFHVACQLHGMLGPSCAVADVRPDGATIWSGSQWPQGDRADLAQMLGLPVEAVRVVWREAAGSYGRLGCDDAAADAALMSQIVERPVRVQWSRADENGWEPVSPAETISVHASLDDEGRIAAFDYRQWSSSHSTAERGNHVAWRLIGGAPGYDRLTGNIYSLEYEVPNTRGRSVFVVPTLQTIYLRGPGGFQSHFATESLMDELALLANQDPVAFRLRHLPERDREVLTTVARLADWMPKNGGHKPAASKGVLRGRGVAYARYGLSPSYIAMVADVAVDAETGRVEVERVFVAQDCGLIVNPDGVLNQVQGNVVHAVSRALKEEVHYSRARITTLDWARYGLLRFTEVPEIRVELLQRLDHPPSVAGEIATMPAAAAIANAIFDATGKRLRTAPFVPERVRSCPKALDPT